jgi:hypothetical protein
VSTQKGRRDHYLPQGYLRGFIDPGRVNEPQPLFKLDIASRKWTERSTKQLGHVTGFYDYAGTGPELECLPSPDETFLELENEFPIVRENFLLLRKKEFRLGSHRRPAPGGTRGAEVSPHPLCNRPHEWDVLLLFKCQGVDIGGRLVAKHQRCVAGIQPKP